MKFLLFCLSLAVGIALEGASVVSIGKIQTPPLLDGREDAVYREAFPLAGFVRPASLDYAKAQTRVKLLHDGRFLYGFIRCDLPEMEKIPRSTPTFDNSQTWRTHSVEFFFEDATALKQVIINCDGSVYDAVWLPDQALKYNTDSKFNSGVEVKTLREAKGFCIEFRLPLKNLVPDHSFRFNIVRNNPLTGEYSTYAPLDAFKWQMPEQFVQGKLTGRVPGFDFVKLPKFGAPAEIELSAPAAVIWNGKKQNLPEGKHVLSAAPKDRISLEVTEAGKTLYSWSHVVPERKFSLTPSNLGSGILRLDCGIPVKAQVIWNSRHNFPGGDPRNGGKFERPYKIIFDVPAGIKVLKSKADPKKHGRFVQSERYLFNAPGWISSSFTTSLPEGSIGEIAYLVEQDGKILQREKIPFQVIRISPVAPPKKFITGYYNGWVKSLKDAEVFRKMGINTFPVRGYSAESLKLAKALKDAGFFVKRGEYFWPGNVNHGGSHGWLEWTASDRAARSRDIGGFYIPQGDSFQLSPSYRGKCFEEAIRKEADFCREAGINYFSFDLEDYIQPQGERGDFHERTVLLFQKYWMEKYPGKKYVAPQIFERTPEKYPELHSAWIEFKCNLWSDFFQEMKKRLVQQLNGASSSPYPGILFTDWSLGDPFTEKGRAHSMRNGSWCKAFDIIELSAYSSLDRAVRQINQTFLKMEKYYPDTELKFILTPSPRRLVDSYYKTTAPAVADELKYAVMETAGFGGKGVIVWYLGIADIESMRQFASGVSVIGRCEDIVLNGKRVKKISTSIPADLTVEDNFNGKKSTWRNQDRVFVKALEHEGKTLVCVSEYREQKPLKFTVNYPVKRKTTVRDLETNELIATLPAGSTGFPATLETNRRCKLLLLEPEKGK